MKKVLFVLALGAFAACGNGSNTEANADSTKIDSSAVAPAPVVAPTADSTVKADSTVAPVAADSAAKH